MKKTKITYRDSNNEITTIPIYDLKLTGEIWKGKQKIRGVFVNRSFHNTEVISTGEEYPELEDIEKQVRVLKTQGWTKQDFINALKQELRD